MKAVIVDRLGGSEVLQIVEVATPDPGPGQVLIKIAYAGINYVDIGRRIGRYAPPPFPFTPGGEGSGTVERAGAGVTTVQPGDRVLAYGLSGGYAEYSVAREETVALLPPSLSLKEAAGIPQIFMTSWNALVHKGKLQPGETILVQSAGNGAGLAAVQIARHLGARSIGTASNAAKMQAAQDAGAEAAINYLETDFEAEVKRLTDGKGVDVVLDGVGGETFAKGLRCLAGNGRMLSLGFSGGRSPISLDPTDLIRPITIVGGAGNFRSLPRGEFETVLSLFGKGALKPAPTTVFPWAEAGAAQQSIEDRQAVGKVVLQVHGDD